MSKEPQPFSLISEQIGAFRGGAAAEIDQRRESESTSKPLLEGRFKDAVSICRRSSNQSQNLL